MATNELTGIYQENDEGQYELLMIVTPTFLDLPDREPWLAELSQELAEGDLWAIRMIAGDSIEDFPLVLGRDE